VTPATASSAGERLRRRRAVAILLAVAIVLVLGASAVTVAMLGGGGAATAGADVDASASPTPSAGDTGTPPTSAPEVTGASEATTEPPGDTTPDAWMVSDEGIGPFQLGMPFADAAALMADRGDCGRGEADPSVYHDADYRLWIVDGRARVPSVAGLQIVEWTTATATPGTSGVSPRTALGIEVGSTEADVRRAYPDAREVQRNGLHLQAGRMYFDIADGAVRGIGVTATEIPFDFCG
jgi:hypothetical protein